MTMEYFFSTIVNTGFDDAVSNITEALKTEGFGILTEIDMQAKLKEKLGVGFKKYKILGACNPSFAHKALQAEEMIGIMLPCNIVISDQENGTTAVAVVHPVAAMMAVQNPALKPLALEVTEKLKKALSLLN
jgi:uncharacterized protein (DUF302 family)